MSDIKSSGTYLLVLHVPDLCTIAVGRLGLLQFLPGFYYYVGSAFGPGGLKARLKHHYKPTTKPHWHVDYLRRKTQLISVCWTSNSTRLEQHWVDELGDTYDVPHKGFGASDSKAYSHLFFNVQADTDRVLNLLVKVTGNEDVNICDFDGLGKLISI